MSELELLQRIESLEKIVKTHLGPRPSLSTLPHLLPIGIQGNDVASAATPRLGDGDYFHITGTTTITAFPTRPSGNIIILEFDGALTLTHNSTSLILQNSTNMTTAAGDIVILISEGDGNWREIGRRILAGATFSGSIQLPAGTLSATALQGPSDPNTGLYFPAADVMGLVRGGATAAYIGAGNTINGAYELDSDIGALELNFRGYQNGTTRFRDFIIYDGKGTALLTIDGSASSLALTLNSLLMKGERIQYILGKDTTERTSVTAATVSLSTITPTSNIPADMGFIIRGNLRKSNGAISAPTLGLRLNATDVIPLTTVFSTTNQAEEGQFEIRVAPRVTGYLQAAVLRSWVHLNGSGTIAKEVVAVATTDAPTADITSIILRAGSDDVVTIAVDEVTVLGQ